MLIRRGFLTLGDDPPGRLYNHQSTRAVEAPGFRHGASTAQANLFAVKVASKDITISILFVNR
jgi:hypothetical protein